MRTVNDKKFESSQLEGWLFLYHLIEKNEIERLQLRLVIFDNNWSKNGSKKSLEPGGPGESSTSLYP